MQAGGSTSSCTLISDLHGTIAPGWVTLVTLGHPGHPGLTLKSPDHPHTASIHCLQTVQFLCISVVFELWVVMFLNAVTEDAPVRDAVTADAPEDADAAGDADGDCIAPN